MGFVGSFFGAAVAFGFFLLGQALTRSYERKRAHYNALVVLERVLNLQLDDAHNMRQLIEGMSESVGRGQLIAALPRPLRDNDDLFLELMDQDLINDLLNHRITVRRMNSDIDNINQAFRSATSHYLDGKCDHATYLSNASILYGKYREIEASLRVFESIVMGLLTHIRLRMQDPRPASFKIVGWLSKVQLRELSDSDFAAERAMLTTEIASTVNPYAADEGA